VGLIGNPCVSTKISRARIRALIMRLINVQNGPSVSPYLLKYVINVLSASYYTI